MGNSEGVKKERKAKKSPPPGHLRGPEKKKSFFWDHTRKRGPRHLLEKKFRAGPKQRTMSNLEGSENSLFKKKKR